MFIGGGCAQGGNGIVDFKLGHGYDIHVAFNHENSLQLTHGLACFIQPVQFLALVEYRRLRAV